ncbi:hypothetical protein AOQ72_06345 [Bradyrhizobium yuanmingense]|uniref:Uncharacterized protein n=1 Tax=Bradyrhizobium yuanmingense TaxID=108015 RepID=A0A0R3CYS1_9BRAD|nr:hypothetical protein AOQ72_06345 [Bradyrhizobium yuanmingense]
MDLHRSRCRDLTVLIQRKTTTMLSAYVFYNLWWIDVPRLTLDRFLAICFVVFEPLKHFVSCRVQHPARSTSR